MRFLIFNTFLLVVFTVSLAFVGCQKDKYDFSYDNSSKEYESSTVRIVNLSLYQQLATLDEPLTNHEYTGTPTRFFPGDGLMKSTWRVPKDLLGEEGETELLFSDPFQVTPSIPIPTDPVKASISSIDGPMDYYTIWPGGSGQPDVVPMPRDDMHASKPDHIKVRLLNLMKSVDALPAAGQTGPLEDLTGSITLTYADGTPVSPQTSNLSISQGRSPYVEIPYGTYQFKILTSDGRQIAATVHGITEENFLYRRMDPPTSRLPVPETNAGITGLTYAPIQTYQPGGVYTIVVAPFPFDYLVTNYYEGAYQNQFKIIEDVEPIANSEFSKLQCVNAYSGESATFQVNGTALGSALKFSEESDYTVLSADNNYLIEAVGSSGTVLASVELSIKPNQNHTVWLWEDDKGEAHLLPVANDLSTEFYANRFDDDGSNNRYEYTMAMSVRYLNLSSNMPNLSYTINNGQDMRQVMQLFGVGAGHYVQHSDSVMYNLEPGKAIVDIPYSRWRTDYNYSFEWMAYESKPGVIPGIWADDIPTFNGQQLIANSELYTEVGRSLPTCEPGVYTIALIGKRNSESSDASARIIAIKHNK